MANNKPPGFEDTAWRPPYDRDLKGPYSFVPKHEIDRHAKVTAKTSATLKKGALLKAKAAGTVDPKKPETFSATQSSTTIDANANPLAFQNAQNREYTEQHMLESALAQTARNPDDVFNLRAGIERANVTTMSFMREFENHPNPDVGKIINAHYNFVQENTTAANMPVLDTAAKGTHEFGNRRRRGPEAPKQPTAPTVQPAGMNGPTFVQ